MYVRTHTYSSAHSTCLALLRNIQMSLTNFAIATAASRVAHPSCLPFINAVALVCLSIENKQSLAMMKKCTVFCCCCGNLIGN